MRDKLTPKNITISLVILLVPVFMYLIDAFTLYISSNYDVFLPLPSGDYILRIVVQAGVYILLAVGLNIVCGFTGLLDLGYAGFYLIGGYTAGLLMARLGISYWIALPLAVINGALWGLLRGIPTLRLTGDYFAIVTFGFAELLVQVVKNEIWLIGGPNGFVNNIPPVTIFGIELFQNWHHYYHILILILLTVFITYRLKESRVGRAWTAIREDEQAAESMGINLSRYKSLAFAVSAAIGALGGGFIAQFQVNISSKLFDFWESIFILCMVVLGGTGSIRGSIIGAAILASLGELLRGGNILPSEFGGARYLIFGIILVVIMRFRPGGLSLKKA